MDKKKSFYRSNNKYTLRGQTAVKFDKLRLEILKDKPISRDRSTG